MFSSALMYCRPGFENEAAAEIQTLAGLNGVSGFVKSKPNSGFILFVAHDPQQLARLKEAVAFFDVIFARQLIWCFKLFSGLPEADRISPLMACLKEVNFQSYSEVFVETADTNEAKELLAFCKSFSNPLWSALKKNGLSEDPLAPKLHIFFMSYESCYIGISEPDNSSPFYMGIPRLKFPSDAPSRSTLKLEEAFQFFISDRDKKELLRPGLRAIDLGAAPGGWTYQFVKRQIAVTAIDNGPMAQSLKDSGLVDHIAHDGFKYRPKKPVDWMVCDMVEQPIKIAKLVSSWFEEEMCENSIFNLKLPMKKRYEEIKKCLEVITEKNEKILRHGVVRCKQLYHDREEVTVFVSVSPRFRRGGRR